MSEGIKALLVSGMALVLFVVPVFRRPYFRKVLTIGFVGGLVQRIHVHYVILLFYLAVDRVCLGRRSVEGGGGPALLRLLSLLAVRSGSVEGPRWIVVLGLLGK